MAEETEEHRLGSVKQRKELKNEQKNSKIIVAIFYRFTFSSFRGCSSTCNLDYKILNSHTNS